MSTSQKTDIEREQHHALAKRSLREQLDKAEKALRRSDADYCALLENPTYGMCRCSMDGKFLNVNHALTTMLGYVSKEELLAAGPITNMIPNSEERALMLDYCCRTSRAEPVEIGWRKKDGNTLKVRLSAWLVHDEQGLPDGYEIIADDVTDRRALEDELRQLADSDPLTGLANHRHVTQALCAEVERAKRTGREFSVVLMDLDGLKKINDRHGHLVGNRALCRLADILRLCCRSIDTAARFGGDEFVLVLPETGADAASQVARRIWDRLANSSEEPLLSVSFGVATNPRDGDTLEELLQNADCALYEMKGQQGNLFREVRWGISAVRDNRQK